MFKTKVKVYSHTGNLEWDTCNSIALGGRITLENIFKGGTSFQENIRQTLSRSLEIAKGGEAFVNPATGLLNDTTNINDYFARSIKYFCIGNGGLVNTTPLEMAKARPHNSRLFNMVPFRCVPVDSGDLTQADRAKYALRRKERINGVWYYTYYLKKFELGNIIVEKADGTPYVISDSHSNPIVSGDTTHPLLNMAVHVFYEMFLKIESEDFKEFYKATNNNSLIGAMITEIGLVTSNQGTYTEGSETIEDVYNAELFSHVVEKPAYLEAEGSAKQIYYTMYS